MKVMLVNDKGQTWESWKTMIAHLRVAGHTYVTYEPSYDWRENEYLELYYLSQECDLIITHGRGSNYYTPYGKPKITIAASTTDLKDWEFHIGNRSDPVVTVPGQKNEWRYGTHKTLHEKYIVHVLIPKIEKYGYRKIFGGK